MPNQDDGINRRDFLHRAAGAALTGSALAAGSNAAQGAEAASNDKRIWRNRQAGMTYRRLGRTELMCSRLAAGWRGNNRLKGMLIEKGVNYLDTSRNYAGGQNEKEIAPLVKKYRDRLFLSSKASGLAGYPRLSFKPGEGAKAARIYTELLDTSLKALQVDHVDCYYLHGVAKPFVLETEELYGAYEKAHKAGKVMHHGFTTHANVGEVLAKAVEVEDKGDIKHDLIMLACKPTSWEGLKDVIVQLRKRDIGLICMKGTGRVGQPAQDRMAELLKMADKLELNDAERAYAYMLHIANFDVLISEMQSIGHVEGNLKLPGMKLTAADRRRLRDRVLAEQRGACHHCGACAAACPEAIEVDAILRYHSYSRHYGHHQDACDQYGALGVDVAAACSACGRCNDVCPAGIDLQSIVRDAPRHLT